jgi:arginyl-tRNA synthetase
VTGSKAFESSEDIAAEIKVLNKVIYEKSDATINKLYDAGKKASLEYFETAYQVLGSAFDHNFFESVTGPVGLVLVQQHMGDVFTQSDGAVIFKGEDYGLHTRVFVNTEGLPTYETKDVGLIQCKEDWSKEVTGKSFDHTITVTGTEQQEYFKVTTKASTLIQPELAGKVELVPNGMLRLSEGKMSSRTGDVIRALDLVADVKTAALERMRENNVIDSEQVAQQVAVAAIKYTILKIAAGKDIVFDVNKSISFEGDSGPYLQYTYARIQSVLDKAAQAGVHKDTTLAPTVPYAVEKLVERFPTVIQTALTDRAPHQLVTYLTELAAEFNSFYAQEKIADPTDQYAPYKVAVASTVGVTLKQGLWALGIEAPERM